MPPALNKFATAVSKVQSVMPTALQPWAISGMFNTMVKFAGTAGISIDEIGPQRAVVTLKNRRRVQNHIGGVHACGMALLSETATGVLLAMNVPDTHLPLCKSFKLDFKRIAKGDLKAVATLTDDMLLQMTTTDKGDVTVPVTVTDEDGNEPIKAEMCWAWVLKNRGPRKEQAGQPTTAPPPPPPQQAKL
eukprot:TRINITY_DN9321_c0_g1_i1.p1 TRINITY_DN9321_c0_g1~~TRINITY_DN9321_c0_g1_i1.p1  ORF type:complete len:190 (-),score=68.00 TRINITY_DN9321_c0_g1_i1:556-1125(-)